MAATIRRQIAALGILESSRCGAKEDRQGLPWICPVGKLGTTTGWMEPLEVLPCAVFVANLATDFRFYRNQSSSCRL